MLFEPGFGVGAVGGDEVLRFAERVAIGIAFVLGAGMATQHEVVVVVDAAMDGRFDLDDGKVGNPPV